MHARSATASNKCAQVDERRASILASLKERNLLTPALEKAINAADTVTTLEDHLPAVPAKKAHPRHHR